MTKLLNRSLKAFALYALLILLISIPVYVLVVDYIWINELDESNWLTLQHTKKRLQSQPFTPAEIENINHIWGELQPGVSIVKADGNISFQDSVYEAIRPNEYDKDDGEDRFRGLKSYLKINDVPYVLTIETNVEESDETLAAITAVTLLFFIFLIVGFILLNRRIAAKSWHSFYQTLRALKSFELSKDISIDLPESGIQEFQELNQSLHQLITNSVNTFQQQKSFTENASHELQTPIALLKSKLDLLIQQKAISPEITEILNSIEAPLSRLSRINKNLLVLAKVENHQYNDKEQIDITDYLESAITLFEDYLDEKQLQLTNSVDQPILVNANAFLMETLIHNLLSNAIRHTPRAGRISVSNVGESLQVMNTGKESLDQKKLFKRFSSPTKDSTSSGLGLAIINEIAFKYSWKVAYDFQDGSHNFSVTF
ncbi:sensor histidine kinase [Phaeodactylibacter xiamenensis]|uniref:sensor histidine kinase n=1 Tax=Phaeodactylibacter xiamenensis TaxID=1524460 RepID=UPI0024A9ED1C|nr:HAMP domain-containing sensor histidine kinase [Phaeodactylibacter xiamenensis]